MFFLNKLSHQTKATWVLTIVLLLTLSVAVIFLISDLKLKGTFVYYDSIPIGDFLDMILNAPSFFLAMTALHYFYFENDYFRLHQAKRNFHQLRKYLSILFIVSFQYGHSMHLVGNAIHSTFTELRPYQIPKTALLCMYFFDETLGHILMNGSWYLFSFVLVLGDFYHFEQGTRSQGSILTIRSVFGIATGAFMGLIHTISYIEGDCPYLGFAMGFIGICSCIYHAVLEYENEGMAMGNKESSKRTFLQKLFGSPMSCIVFSCCTSLILCEISYYLRFGEFIQPSHVGGVGCALFGFCKDVIKYPSHLSADLYS